jgi:hypothetical protein
MTRLVAVAAGVAMLIGLAACGDDGLFNTHPPVPQSSGTSADRASPASGASTGNPAEAATRRSN